VSVPIIAIFQMLWVNKQPVLVKFLPKFFAGFKLFLGKQCGYNLPPSMDAKEKLKFQPTPITLRQYLSATVTGFEDYHSIFMVDSDPELSQLIDINSNKFYETKNVVKNRSQGIANTGLLVSILHAMFKFLPLSHHS
jgi:hypothetical protein